MSTEIMDLPKRRILCPDHGEADACLLCVHLKKGSGLGFNMSLPSSNFRGEAGPMREAWCDRCGFWRRMPAPLAATYSFIAGGQVTACEHCLELARIANERP